MILGSGLLGIGLKTSGLDFGHHTIFAAGVSDSGCRDKSAFAREVEVLRDLIERGGSGRRLVYFSTLSIESRPPAMSHYLAHKQLAEQIVMGEGGLVIRLPLIHGFGGSPTTLINYFVKKIRLGEGLVLQENARRNVISISDFATVLHRFLLSPYSVASMARFSSRVDFSPLQLAHQLREHFNSKSEFEIASGGYQYPNYFHETEAWAHDLEMARLDDYALQVALSGQAG